MKNIILAISLALASFSISFAQENKIITLEQTPGEFTVKELTISPGEYVFEVVNNGIDREVGLVVAPEGKTDQAHHIQEAYLKKTANKGETSSSNLVTLSAGTYVYFCPLNPTPQYKLIVKE